MAIAGTNTMRDRLAGTGIKNRRELWAGLAALALGGAIAWRAVASRRARRRLLRSGQIRSLQGVWRTVGQHRIFARISTGLLQSAPPVVLVHGWGISSSYFVPTAERLAAKFDVYAPDLLGHGRSDTPHIPRDIAGLARNLLDWLEVMQLERVSLVGHSMGCQIAVEAALEEPARVDRLVLIGLTPDPQGRGVGEQFRRFAIGGAYERASLNNVMMKDYARMGRRLVPEFRFMLHDPIEHKLPNLSAPVLLVRGEKDPVAPQRWTEEASRLLRDAPVAVIPGWGHAVNFSAPEELVAALQPFLRESAAASV
jgi:2-hydroxy-6-oxonona-2,4-dienedioate hydrolase